MADKKVVEAQLNITEGESPGITAANSKIASIEARVANVGISVSGNRSGPAGGAASNAATSASMSSNGRSAMGTASTNPGPTPGRIPNHGATGSIPAVTRSQNGRFTSNMASREPIYQAPAGPTYREGMYSSQAGPGRVQIPSQSALAFTQAYANQSQFNTPSDFAHHYAMANYEGSVQSRVAAINSRTSAAAIRGDRFFNRLEARSSLLESRRSREDDGDVYSKAIASSFRSMKGILDEHDQWRNELSSSINARGRLERQASAIDMAKARRSRKLESLDKIEGVSLPPGVSDDDVSDADIYRVQTYATIHNKLTMRSRRENSAASALSRKKKYFSDALGYDTSGIDNMEDMRDLENQHRIATAQNRAASRAAKMATAASVASGASSVWPNSQSSFNVANVNPNAAGGGGGGGFFGVGGMGGGGFFGPPNPAIGPPLSPQSRLQAAGQSIAAGLPAYGTRFLKGGLVAGAEYAGRVAQNDTEFITTGRRDIGAEGAAGYSLAGGVIGAAIGSLFPGYGTIIGAGIGSQVGNQVGKYVMAPATASLTRQQGAIPGAALSASFAGDHGRMVEMPRYIPGPTSGPGGGASFSRTNDKGWVNPVISGALRIANKAGGTDQGIDTPGEAARIGKKYWSHATNAAGQQIDVDYTQYYMTGEQLSQTYSNAYSALVEAGIDPEQKRSSGEDVRTTTGTGGNAAIVAGRSGYEKGNFVGKDAAIALIAVGNTVNFAERTTNAKNTALYRYYAENAARKWGFSGKEIFDKSVAPIIEATNQTGDNLADILTRFGVGSTNSYVEAGTDIGKTPRVSLKELMGVQKDYQTGNRNLEFSQLKPRGRGAAAESAMESQQSVISRLPGGEDSLVYAQLGEQKRRGGMQRNREEDIMSYDLPMSALEGQETRRQFLPNMPGYGLKLSLQRMGLRTPYLKQRMQRYAAQVANGSLTEEEQLGQAQEIEGLKNAQAQDLGNLAEGGSNRMLAFSGGRASFFSRMDSLSLARSAIRASGSPQIGTGSVNGGHLGYQNDFFRAFDTAGFSALGAIKPHSLTGPVNSPGAATGRSESILEAIKHILEQIRSDNHSQNNANPGSGTRASTGFGNLGANIAASSFNQKVNYGRGNA